MVEIKNSDDLEKWLEDKPREWAIAIAARASMRALPALGSGLEILKTVKNWQDVIILSVFRSNHISGSAAYFPDPDIWNSALSAARSAALSADSALSAARSAALSADSALSALSAALSADSAALSALSADSAALSARSARSAARSVLSADSTARSARSALSAAWEIVDQDAKSLLEDNSAGSAPLWRGDWRPELETNWSDLKEALLAEGPHWKTLIQWYEDRLMGDKAATRTGRPRIKEMELEIANLAEEIWRDAKRANEAIAEIQTRYWDKQVNLEAPEEAEPTLTIPPQKPAAIEPIWVDGVLRLPGGPATANLPQPSLEASLMALKETIEDLVLEARKIGNIDQRFVGRIEQISQTIPSKNPDQVALFRLGHKLDYLRRNLATVSKEWPDYLSSDFASMLFTYDNTVRQFPDWKLFVQNANDNHLTDEEKEAVPDLVEDATEILKEAEIAGIAEVAIRNALEQYVAELYQARQDKMLDHVPEGPWREIPEQHQIGILETISNLYNAFISKFTEGWTVGKDGKGFIVESAKSLSEEAMKSAQNLGASLKKVVKKILGSKTLRIGSGIGLFETHFGWIDRILGILEKLI